MSPFLFGNDESQWIWADSPLLLVRRSFRVGKWTTKRFRFLSRLQSDDMWSLAASNGRFNWISASTSGMQLVNVKPEKLSGKTVAEFHWQVHDEYAKRLFSTELNIRVECHEGRLNQISLKINYYSWPQYPMTCTNSQWSEFRRNLTRSGANGTDLLLSNEIPFPKFLQVTRFNTEMHLNVLNKMSVTSHFMQKGFKFLGEKLGKEGSTRQR